ncbi:MAG: starch-binding protein, partial [Ruminococcus sp.]|nr:starch-binding protein [Ruminococcus sp.]
LSDKLTWPSGGYASGASRKNMLAVKSLKADNTAQLKLADDHLGNRTIFKVFDYSATSNNKNGKEVLFTVPKGETRTITIAIWLEALDQSYNTETIPVGATVDVDIKFCSSWDVVDTITLRDYTADQWVDNTANKKLWLVNDTTGYSYEMKYTSKGTTTSTVSKNTWTVDVPRAVQDITFRCEDKEYDDTPPGVWAPAALRTVSGVTQTTFTAFGSTAGIWYDGEVTQIGLSDYTTDSWLNNNGDDGKSPKMKVEIDYSGTDLKYSMTGTPVADKYGKNTWYAYIPSSINDVIFDRCDSTTEYVYNLWNATDRGSETIYRVYDTKKVEVDKSNTVYLQIPASIEAKFFKNQTIPHISLTGDNNVTYINSLNGNLSSLKKNNSYYPQSDTWPTNSSNLKNGQMTKIEGTFVWYYEFDSIADTDIITFWDCDSATHNDLDSDTRFAPAISFDKSKGNMFIINGYIELDDTAFTDTAYVFTGYWDFYGSESGDTEVDVSNGVWGVYTIPTGPSVNFKHYDTSISAMTASFVYENATYSVSLTKGNDNLTWSTTSIPDGVTSIDFSDGTYTWETTSRNTYCFALDKSHYEWHSTNTYNRIYLTQNYTWDDLRVYYTSGNGNSDSWPGNSMIKLKTNGDGHYVYVALVRTSPDLIVFNGTENGSRKQTKDITSNINTDLKGFYFLSWDSSVGKANTNTWDVTVDFLNQ